MRRAIMPQEVRVSRLPLRLVPLLVVGYACLLPRELTVEVLEAALFPYRLALILMAPFAITRLAQAPVRLSLTDFFAIFAAAWFVLALLVTTSVEAGLISGMSYAIDLGLAYLLGRASVRTAEDLRTAFLFMLPGLLALVALLAVESISHRMLLRPLLADVLGLPAPNLFERARYGLLRATGPFPHPILGGVFLASLLPLAWYLAHNGRNRLIGCLAVCGAIFTVSSTAVLGLVVGAGLIMMDIVQRLSRLPIFVIASFYLALVGAAVSVGSESGLIKFLIRNMTFDAGSGYYRLLIWEYGGAEALAHPLFGIGQRNWVRPDFMFSDTVDTYWLVLAMNFGFPALIAVVGLVGTTLVAVLRSQNLRHPVDRNAGKAVAIFLAVVFVSGFTVHFWEALHGWIMLVTGCGASLASEAQRARMPLIQQVPGPEPDYWPRPVEGQRLAGSV